MVLRCLRDCSEASESLNRGIPDLVSAKEPAKPHTLVEMARHLIRSLCLSPTTVLEELVAGRQL